AFNPSANCFLEEDFFLATEDEMEKIMQLAESAFIVYRKKSNAERALFLETIAIEIMATGEDLINRCVAESGLPVARVTGERARTVGQLQLFSQTIRNGDYVNARIDPAIPDRKPLPRYDLRRMLISLGPVLVFGASNFPLAFSTAGGDTASALAAGCPVIVKAHSSHPGTNELISQAIIRAAVKTGMPEGVFSMFYADRVLGITATRHPAIKAIGFTGSRLAGMAIFNAAVNRKEPIPVYAEMSAVNPVIILPGALEENADAITNGLVLSINNGTGQFCTNPGIVFLLDAANTEEFLKGLVEKMKASLPGTMLNPNICSAYSKGIASLKNIPGVVEIAASERSADRNKNEGAPVLLMVSADQFQNDEKLREEVFGPSSLIVLCQSLSQLENALSGMEGQLTATIHAGKNETGSVRELLPLMAQKAGRVLFNGFPTGVEVSPSQQHGGPFPASTDGRATSVGTAAMERFMRPVAFQNFPDELLPEPLKENNPLGIVRLLNNRYVHL
ncbi:MAG: aldehyde dehydrogenase (NADP(+)), partial [Chitinophagales bacterium]